MKLIRAVLAAFCACILAVAFAACGSDDEDGSGGGAASQEAAAPEGDPIVVGFVCSCSGAQAAVLGATDEAAKAWAAEVNANGGVNGHPVELVVKDDGGDPAKGLQAVKELVEESKVIAIVGQTSLTEGAWEKYVTDKGIPVVGGLPQARPFLTNANFFASGSSLPVVAVGAMSMVKNQGKKSIGLLYCAESPVCAQLDPIAKGAAQLVGGLEYRSGKVSATAPNFTAPCLANKEAGVDALYVAHNSEVVLRVIEACANQGYEPTVIGNAVSAAPSWLDSPSFEGAQLAASNAPLSDESNPAMEAFLAALDEHAPDVRESDEFSDSALYPYVGGKLFEAAAEAAKLAPTSTPNDVKKGLYTLENETLDGLAPPLTFTKGKPAFPACYFEVTITDGAFKAPKGSEPTCLAPEQVKALGQALAAAG